MRKSRFTKSHINGIFKSVEEMQDFATWWVWTYNHERPGGITPNQRLAMAA